jgi:hypothetical protein
VVKKNEPAFEIKEMNVVDLKLDPNQTKKHPEDNAAAIRASLEDHGQLATLLVRKGYNHVIAGNERLRIMRDELKWSKVWCLVKEMTDKEARMASHRMNRTGEMGHHDQAALADLFKFLDQEGEDLARMGYTEQDVRAIITSAEKELSEFSKEQPQLLGKDDSGDDPESEPTNEAGAPAGGKGPGKNGAPGDGCWFYVEFYGEDAKFIELCGVLQPIMRGKHELDPAEFEKMARAYMEAGK